MDALLQRKQGLWRADAEARVARCVARDAVVVVLGQGDVHLLARGADVEPGELVYFLSVTCYGSRGDIFWDVSKRVQRLGDYSSERMGRTGLRCGHGAGRQAQGVGVEGFGLVEGAMGDRQVDVMQACDEWLCGRLGVGGGHCCCC